MANVEKAVSEILDIVEHLVATHVRWNVDLAHDEATVKIAGIRQLLSSDEPAEGALTLIKGGKVDE